jgi:hypothetical protein
VFADRAKVRAVTAWGDATACAVALAEIGVRRDHLVCGALERVRQSAELVALCAEYRSASGSLTVGPGVAPEPHAPTDRALRAS